MWGVSPLGATGANTEPAGIGRALAQHDVEHCNPMVNSGNREAVRRLHDPAESGRLRRNPLFDVLDEDVQWEALGPPELFPWAGTHRGHDGVRRWFEVLDAAMRYDSFELRELYADGETVVEVIAAAGTARATGLGFSSDVVRVWTFRSGKAIRVRSFYDTHSYAAALRGES